MDDVYDVEVEAQAKTVEEAKALAVEKLGVPAERVQFTVLQEGKGGFLGMGGQPAVITARAKPPDKKKRRRKRKRSTGSGESGEASASADKGRGNRGNGGGGAKPQNRSGNSGGRGRQQGGGGKSQGGGRPKRSRGNGGGEAAKQGGDARQRNNDTPEASIEDQGAVAVEFLEGLLGAFGLEGTVTTEIKEDILIVRVDGDQTEALVGNRGAIMQSVLELTRTVIQRKTFGAPRMRIDIAGYGERRREALKIYAGKLAEKVIAEGGEVMLEPMNPADRKVVHDAIGEIDGVESFSEGEEPHRSVVISAVAAD